VLKETTIKRTASLHDNHDGEMAANAVHKNIDDDVNKFILINHADE
jgi:hypothetical protein